MLTRKQQEATRALKQAEEAWLNAYGWVYDSNGWRHRKVKQSLEGRAYSLRDAVAATRADLTLGWP